MTLLPVLSSSIPNYERKAQPICQVFNNSPTHHLLDLLKSKASDKLNIANCRPETVLVFSTFRFVTSKTVANVVKMCFNINPYPWLVIDLKVNVCFNDNKFRKQKKHYNFRDFSPRLVT